MRKGILLLFVFVILLATPAAVRYLRFYRFGTPARSLPADFNPENVAQVGTPESIRFVDEPEVGSGLVLLDRAHGNQFTLDEIGFLDGRLSQRGFELLPFAGGDLAAALRPVNAFVVITPTADFSLAEVQAVSDFVERGGRLLLIGDPTRYNVLVEDDGFEFVVTIESDKIPLNSLANEFDIIFNGDYLYNTVQNEGNFRNILLRSDGFAESSLTEGLDQLAFYGAHSLQIGPTGTALLAADDQTWSSATDRPGGLSLAATSRDGRVLALGDIQFMVEPYYTVYDNGRFIAQIADFLTDSDRRRFVLSDFPYFFSEKVSLIYTGAPELGPDAFDEIIMLQEAFQRAELELELAVEPTAGQDALFLGLYNQAGDVSKLLEAADIALLIDPPIEAAAPDAETGEPDDEIAPEEDAAAAEEDVQRLIQSRFGNVHMAGTALILLDEGEDGRYSVVVLAAGNQGLENTINRLLQAMPLNADYALADCLLQDNLALCPTDIVDEEVEAELLTSGAADLPEDNGGGDVDEDTGDDTAGGDLDAVSQGTIVVGETFDAVLAENENHAWTFNSGPAVIDIVVQGADDLDAIIELYDPNNELLQTVDDSFTGDAEEMLGVDIPDEGDYTIVVRDFFADGGSYTISVTEGELVGSGDGGGGGIFIFADDDGTPINDGISSTAVLADLLAADYDVTTWVSTIDGPLSEDTLAGYQLVVWDTGDYEDDDGLFGEDTGILLNYLDSGGDMFITGSAPALFSTFERGPLNTVQVYGDDPILLANLTDGQMISLDQTYDTVLSEFFIEDLEEGSIGFLLNAGETAGAGTVVGLAAPANEFNDQNAVILLFPFVALPADIQPVLANNILSWFESVQ